MSELRGDRTGQRAVDIVAVTLAQFLGLIIAYVAGWVVFFDLPPESLGVENDPGARLAGAGAALVAALALPAGCWEAWRRTRHRVAAGLALLITIAALVVAGAWAVRGG